VPRVRYFAQARDAAGTTLEELAGETVGDILEAAVALHGERLATVLRSAAVWLDGEPCQSADRVEADGEVAVLPPVSGGLGEFHPVTAIVVGQARG